MIEIGGWFRYRRLPNRLRFGWKRVQFYWIHADGSPVLKDESRWWQISGVVINGVHEIIFRKRGFLA